MEELYLVLVLVAVIVLALAAVGVVGAVEAFDMGKASNYLWCDLADFGLYCE